jgi:hypothetical protein
MPVATSEIKPVHPGGRPTTYNAETATTLCGYLAEGQSLRTACKNEGMPNPSTVFMWMRVNPEFSKQYEQAKAEAADAMAEELLDIADDGANDYMEKLDEAGEVAGYRVNGENIQRSRLRADVRKFLMAKMKPKKYGEQTTLTLEPSGVPMFQVVIGKPADGV